MNSNEVVEIPDEVQKLRPEEDAATPVPSRAPARLPADAASDRLGYEPFGYAERS